MAATHRAEGTSHDDDGVVKGHQDREDSKDHGGFGLRNRAESCCCKSNPMTIEDKEGHSQ